MRTRPTPIIVGTSRLLRINPIPPSALRTMNRAARRSQAIASNNLPAYRMAGRTQPPAKGKGAPYRRAQKHQGR